MIPLCQQLSPLRPDSNSRSQSASQNLKSIWKATQWMGILQLESDEVTNSGAVHAGSWTGNTKLTFHPYHLVKPLRGITLPMSFSSASPIPTGLPIPIPYTHWIGQVPTSDLAELFCHIMRSCLHISDCCQLQQSSFLLVCYKCKVWKDRKTSECIIFLSGIRSIKFLNTSFHLNSFRDTHPFLLFFIDAVNK